MKKGISWIKSFDKIIIKYIILRYFYDFYIIVMFKKILFLLLSFCLIFFWTSNVFAWWKSTPWWVVEDLHDSDIQKTSLNDVWWSSQWINWTLTSIKWHSNGYIQWLWFIWLAIALILIIYNGMLLLWNFSWEDKLAKAKKRFLSLILWVIILTSWYVIIKLVMSLISQIFS